VRLVNGIGILIAQLLYNPLNPVKFFGSSKISNNTLKTAHTVSFIRLSLDRFIL
jgi:hypothetical protein